MQYMGSKNRIAKEIVPIIQNYIDKDVEYYIEPFCGGCAIIDKIVHHNKIGSDINRYLIALLEYAQENELPLTITENEYKLVKSNMDNYADWYVGLVGFCGSFGAKWFGGFARRYNKDGTLFDVPRQAINSLRKQSENKQFKNINFLNTNYLDLPRELNNAVIYNDPPYKGTTSYKDGRFDSDKFYDWCVEKAQDNIVLVSEYYMPEDRFECIWEKEHYTSLGSGVNKNMNNAKIEKLWIVK